MKSLIINLKVKLERRLDEIFGIYVNIALFAFIASHPASLANDRSRNYKENITTFLAYSKDYCLLNPSVYDVRNLTKTKVVAMHF